MKHLISRILVVVAALVAGVGHVSLPPAHAQSILIPPSVQGVAGIVTVDDTDELLKCKYVGPATGTTTAQNSGTIEVIVTSSDIHFKSGPQGTEIADTTLECPVSGALGGIIDVSDAACNTAGEIIDIVNAPSSNFRCVILDGFRTDVADARLVTMAATRATTNAGIGIKWDTSTAFDMSVAVVPTALRSMAAYVKPQTRTVQHDVFGGTRTVILKANATSTFGSGTSFLTVSSVAVDTTSLGRSQEIVTPLFNEVGGATTANKIFDLNSPIGIIGNPGEKVVVRLDNSAAMSAAVVKASGYMQRSNVPQ